MKRELLEPSKGTEPTPIRRNVMGYGEKEASLRGCMRRRQNRKQKKQGGGNNTQ